MAKGKLTTHILDATHGCPAHDVLITLFKIDGTTKTQIAQTRTNDDGRTDAPMLDGGVIATGVYELEFQIGDYFRTKIDMPENAFLDIVPIRFGIADVDAHYHVPLLASPFSYSTYRGS